MLKKLILFLFFCSLVFQAHGRCVLKDPSPIIIGCTYKCDFVYRFRLQLAAISLGYRTEIIDMRKFGDPLIAMSKVDGILIPGGADIDPEFYLPHVSSELQKYTEDNLHLVKFSREGKFRDEFEYSLVKTYSEGEEFENLPMLGICRGLQMMSVAQGIPLYLDINTELGIRNRYNVFDRIKILRHKGPTLTASLFSQDFIRGFKFHHQGIRVPYFLENQDKYPQVKITASSHQEKIAEAIEYLHRPAIGVQYHPEKSFSAASRPLFRWLFTKACEYKNSHKD